MGQADLAEGGAPHPPGHAVEKNEGPRPGLVGGGAGPDAARCVRLRYCAMRIIIAATSPRVQPACGSRATPPLPVSTPVETAHSIASVA